MSFLLRMLSPSFRRATAAEAVGEYLLAARDYALCGQRDKVCEMHLLQAERLGERDARVAELRAAVHFADLTTARGKELLRRIGQAYLTVLRRGVITDRDQILCREAAALALRADDPATAAHLYELLGDEAGAATAYQEAGELERMESVLQREEQRRLSEDDLHQRMEQHRLHDLLGERHLALLSLRDVPALPGDASVSKAHVAARRLLEAMQARKLPAGRVVLRGHVDSAQRSGAPSIDSAQRSAAPSIDSAQRSGAPSIEGTSGEAVLYVGALPLVLGRGAECGLVLRDAGISRCHASIAAGPGAGGPGFVLRDLQSKNGTTLNGLRVAGELPLRGAGRIGLGDHSELSFAESGAILDLRIDRGLDRGFRARVSSQPLPLGAGATLRFEDGFPLVTHPEGAVLMGGRRAPRGVQLLRGDVFDAGGVTYEVVA